MVYVMTSIAIGVAQKLLAMDAEQRTTHNSALKRFALLNLAVGLLTIRLY
jgi:hypothetical protein